MSRAKSAVTTESCRPSSGRGGRFSTVPDTLSPPGTVVPGCCMAFSTRASSSSCGSATACAGPEPSAAETSCGPLDGAIRPEACPALSASEPRSRPDVTLCAEACDSPLSPAAAVFCDAASGSAAPEDAEASDASDAPPVDAAEAPDDAESSADDAEASDEDAGEPLSESLSLSPVRFLAICTTAATGSSVPSGRRSHQTPPKQLRTRIHAARRWKERDD